MKRETLDKLITSDLPTLRVRLGWATEPIQLCRGRCGWRQGGVHVDMDGWHLRSGDRVYWLGGTLSEAFTALVRLLQEGGDEEPEHTVDGLHGGAPADPGVGGADRVVGGEGLEERTAPPRPCTSDEGAGGGSGAQPRDEGKASVEAGGEGGRAPQQAASMMVLRVEVWPGGDHTKARTVAVGTWALRSFNDDGLACYNVVLFKNLEHGGPYFPPTPDLPPETVAAIHAPAASAVWKRGTIGGHRRGARGAWDLIGGSLGGLLDDRLRLYRKLGKADFKAAGGGA